MKSRVLALSALALLTLAASAATAGVTKQRNAPIDERALPFGKTVMLFDGVPAAQLEPLGEARTPGLADLFVATMKGTYA